ncbi:hypothetical protein [Spirosoma validum]|uniref:Uncharacterized protein n=1 Tax=Spirosoma validum TaxID=2771355 RepID=A0A927B0Z1_9BACT|nr:hypothetical protein [Spirosoma validum]MBD2753257.1 hypothetical protein [Spirosoma validum]
MNFIWSRDPQEAYENPYEYEAQEQFLREAKKLLDQLFSHLMETNRSFNRDDTSVEKAVWMLLVDACDTLRDCVELINKKQHRPAGKLFRDIIETIDCATYFHASPPESEKKLKDWYNNESPKHGDIRYWLSTQKMGDLDELKKEHHSMSKFTHRTYRALAYNYILGVNDILAYEGEYSHSMLPHPIALCCSLLANYAKLFASSVVYCSLVGFHEITSIWELAIEKEPVKKSYSTPRDIYQKYVDSKTVGTDNHSQNTK